MGTEGGRRTDGARRARMEENRRMILAGEIGATRTRLAAFETQGNKLQQVVEKIYMSQEQSGLPEIISDFIRTEGIPVQSACFGVAGPVRAGRSKISNLPWIIDSRELTRQLKLNSVGLINDLEAYAYGIQLELPGDRKSTRLNSSHGYISYAVFCLKKKKNHRWYRS